MKLDPFEVCFAEKKEEPGQAKPDSCTISVNVGKRNLYLITVSRHLTVLLAGNVRWLAFGNDRTIAGGARMVAPACSTSTSALQRIC